MHVYVCVHRCMCMEERKGGRMGVEKTVESGL